MFFDSQCVFTGDRRLTFHQSVTLSTPTCCSVSATLCQLIISHWLAVSPETLQLADTSPVKGMHTRINMYPLVGTGNYSATSNNMKLVHWPLTVGYNIWYSEEAPPCCTKCNSPPINGQCTRHRIAV